MDATHEDQETRTCKVCGETRPLKTHFQAQNSRRADGTVQVYYLRTCKFCYGRSLRQGRVERLGVDGVRQAQAQYNARRSRRNRLNGTLRSRYGMSVEDHAVLAEHQDHRCAICRRPFEGLVEERRTGTALDHDHVTGKVRGMLCNDCNQGLGDFWDNPEWLRSAAAYLEAGGVPLAVEHSGWTAKKAHLSTSRIRDAKPTPEAPSAA